MYNTKDITKKITSLTLMAIMVAGGMTFAVPGIIPAAEAANANLFVSAENSQFNNHFAGPQVIEVVINDNDIKDPGESQGEPDVTVNGKDLRMVQATDGNWYGYFADRNQVIEANKLNYTDPTGKGVGLSFGEIIQNTTDAETTIGVDVSNTMGIAVPGQQDGSGTEIGFNVIREAKSPNINVPLTGQIGINTPTPPIWPFVQLYEFSQGGKAVVQYNKGGGYQATTLTFDTVEDFAGIDLDRTTYPRGAQVHVTITDAWLNIDPTDEDSWTWDTSPENSGAYYQIFDESGDTPGIEGDNLENSMNGTLMVQPVDSSINIMQEDAFLLLDLGAQGDPVIRLKGNGDSNTDHPAIAHLDNPVTVTEQGPNSGIFGTYDESDESVLVIRDLADRGTSATIDYNADPKSVLVRHNTATIDIQPPNDDWSSGEEIPIVLVDADANKNSRSDEDLALTNRDALIPTLVTGDPFTLGEGNPHVFFLDIGAEHDATDINPANFTITTPRSIVPTDDNAVTVEKFSDRAIINVASATSISADGMLIRLGTDLEDLRATISRSDASDPSDDPTPPWNTPFKGFNLINYDLRSLADANDLGDIEISVVVHRNATSLDELERFVMRTSTADSQGLTEIEDSMSDLFDTDMYPDNLDVSILYRWTNNAATIEPGEYPIVTDFFSFGFHDDGYHASERVSNQIIRLELEEDADNSGRFAGTLEYTMINQLNILEPGTYDGLATISDEASFIVFEDLTDEDAPRVNYFDLGQDGVSTQIADQEEAPSHSGVVTLDSNTYKVADTVTVTLSDPDLNVDSSLVDIFTVVESDDPFGAYDSVGTAPLPNGTRTDEHSTDFGFGPLGRLVDVTFNDERWTSHNVNGTRHCGGDADEQIGRGVDIGLHATGFTLVENGTASGIFTGDFQIPAVYCQASGEVASVTGTDIEVNYVDFRDASGEIIEVGDSAGVRANTGSVSLDRTVYPVPWGTIDQHPDDGGSVFPIHNAGIEGDVNIDAETLGEGVLTIHVRINDPDFDVSASGEDTIAEDVAGRYDNGDPYEHGPLKISVSRGAEEVVLAYAGGDSVDAGIIDVGDDDPQDVRRLGPINEIAPDAGIFELDFPILYTDGPSSTTCPDTTVYTQLNADHAATDEMSRFDIALADAISNENYCVLQGDILTVEYTDPTDASGDPNTVTDSATFDLRNGVLQSDKSVYIIGSDMILTVIEPDWDLDNDAAETYDLDVIEWDSDAATVSMGDRGEQAAYFDPEPTDLRETGDSTGIFQVVIEIPEELDNDRLERGEQIVLEYTDWGPSGADYVGQEEEDVNLTVFTSNFGATIELDQKVYSWTDKVYITIVAPDHNFDSDLVDEIGESGRDPIRIATRGNDLDNYKLVETGTDTGIFTGEVILTGFNHDSDGNSATGAVTTGFDTNPRTEPANNGGPTNGFLAATDDDGLTVSFEFSEDETVVGSALIRWNIGEVQWLEQSYPASGSGVLRVVDPDMNLNPESVDNFAVDVWSDTDSGGIDLTVTETNEATGIFEGTVQFTITDASSGHRLRVSEGDTITGEYDDNTLPSPYNTSDQIGIKATSIIGTIVPPLERAPASSLRTVDTLGNALDSVSVDQQVQITADLVSGQDKDQEFAYIVQVQDSSGVTVELAWITGTLSPGQSFSPSKSWVPTMPGTYTATAFVWESVSTPTALSPPAELTITVN